MRTTLEQQSIAFRQARASLSRNLIKEIGRLAISILKGNSNLSSFNLSMGTWCFYDNRGAPILSRDDCWQGYYSGSFLYHKPRIKEMVTPEVMSIFNIIDEYDYDLHLTGHKLIISRDGNEFKILT